jgi:LuxR family maltose regulon positive regulatory protein
MLGLAYWTRGDLEAGAASWTEAVRNLERAGSHADVLGCSIALGDIRQAQGRLADARRVYDLGLRLGTHGRTSPLRGTADMHVGLAELHVEWNELGIAAQHLEASAELGETLALPQNAYRSLVAMARLRQAEGDPDRAVGLLDEAERRYAADFFPEVRPIHALRTRMWVAQGRLADARAWARDRGLSSDDELGYLRECEHFTLARIQLAAGDRVDAEQALRLLERLADAAESGRRGRSVVEALALQALAHRLLGERDRALRSLERALALAAPEGYVRLFVDEGAPMAALLGDVAKEKGTAASYAERLVAASGEPGSAAPIRKQPLVEALSERELEVLRLLTSDLDGPDIARELFVSVNTLRTHTKNIFAKLGVTSRRAAVRRASELGLLPPIAGH